MKFPSVEPEIEVRYLPDETMTVECRDARSFFISLEDGASCEFAFYDYPHRSLTGITRTKVEGRMIVNGKECFEIVAYDWEPGEEESPPRHWYLALENGQLHWVRFIWRDKGESGWIGQSEEIEATPLPTALSVGLRVDGHEVYTCGDERRQVFTTRMEVTGVAEVKIGGRQFRCIREVWTSFESDGKPLKLAELFISEQGRTVLFRRYNGRGFRNYEQLEGNPELVRDGEVYRLWYDCIPDHVIW